MFDWLESKIVCWSPAGRRRAAVHLLFWSLILAIANVVLFLMGILNEGHLILVTLILSWLAITFTAADLIATTDVREETTTKDDDACDI